MTDICSTDLFYKSGCSTDLEMDYEVLASIVSLTLTYFQLPKGLFVLFTKFFFDISKPTTLKTHYNYIYNVSL